LKIDFFYTLVILKNMKITVSLPDAVFLDAEETAKNMDISRSTLFLNALKDYLKKNSRKNITQRLNEIYSAEYYKEDYVTISNAAIESIKETTKNDAW
jgi:metal-responsive CopG/Arc/MetJ family transcriptional regulator